MKKSEHSEFELNQWYQEGRRRMSDGLHLEAIQAFTLAIDSRIACGQVYFYRGVCNYRAGNYRQAKDDLEAAALFGCRDALFWSKHDIKNPAEF